MESDDRSFYERGILGAYVHFPDKEGDIRQGTIVAAWLTGEIRVTILCKDGHFRDAWLVNVTHGAPAKTKELQGGV